MSGEKKGIVKRAKEFAKKARETVKKIINTIKFFITPLGTILAWLIFIIFAVILLYVVVNLVATAFKQWLGINTDYITSNEDLDVIKELYASGYASQVDPENFVNFKAFEYAVLLDASEYIRIQGQEKFSIVKNQGLYKKESEWLSDKLAGNEEYIESLKEPETPAIKLVSTISETDQSNIAEGVLKGIIEKATGMRNIDVVKELGRKSKEKETLGGNNRVSGPFLVYEFVYSELAKKTTSSKDKSSSTSTVANSTENTSSTEGTSSSENTGSTEGTNPTEATSSTEGTSSTETTGSTEGTNVTETTNTTESTNNSATKKKPTTALEKFSSGELGGSLIPYIYVIREEIDYDFYFDESGEAIKIPLLLNAYNSDLGESTERAKEAKRAMGGIDVRVWPDLDASGDYTWVPYYTDETNKTIYKIPLKTLIGRYMPRTELLHTWTLLQQDIAQNNSFEQEDEKLQIINEVTDKIKQLYSEVCLEGEGTTTHQETVTEKKVNEENKIEDVTNTYTYTEDLTNTKSFVTFQKAGIETTRYIDFKDDAKKVTYVADFIPAYLVGEEFSISYKPGNSSNSGFTSVDVEGTVGEMSGGKQGKINMKLSEISVPNLSKTEFISGYGDEKDGYSPPSDLHHKDEGYLYTGGANLEGVRHAILMAACKNKGIDPTSATIDVEVKFNPIFVTGELKTSKALEIEHRRMPILLVKSAITWAREIEYTHVIKQEMFEPTDPSYLVPNCVSSMGIHSFTTNENSGAYRGKAYEEIFSFLQEKNVVSMLLNLETFADQGIEDCYEYMRELYKLVMASQNYSQTAGKKRIHPGTYTYVYLQNSILYYNDRQSQAIYWQELLGQRGPVDALLKDEVENVRSRDPDIKWQILEYNKYEECEGKVYALNPYGSGYVRAYQQQAKTQNPDDPNINGAYSPGSHEGADLYGRNRIDSMLQQGESATDDYVSVTRKIFNYGLKQLESIYTPQKAKEYFIKKLKEEQSYMPVVAVAPGKVEAVGFNGRSGFCVSILHDKEGTSTLYCHLKRWPNVAAGDYIGAGTVIGYEGNTGRSGGTHLHFEIHKPNSPEEVENPETNTVDPQYYIFPTFNPFYYEEKIAEEGLSLSSEYMTLYRTVYMADISDEKKIKSGDLKSSKPDRPLLQNANNLILEQGRKELKIDMTGSLDWITGEVHDLYIGEEFFDINLALQKGLLDVDPEFRNQVMDHDYIVRTDLAGNYRLPALTREELVYILENWLPHWYRNKEEYNWLMENVFTDETIDKIIESQNEYKVSAVFALAVGVVEQQLGLADIREKAKGKEAPLGRPGIYNIFSITGTKGGGFYFNDVMWNKYSSYGDAFESFARLIAGGTYFGAGLYKVSDIGPIYCEDATLPGVNWINQVTGVIADILNYYTGNDYSEPGGSFWFGSNDDLVNVINMMMQWMNRGGDNQFYYCRASNSGFPPYKRWKICGEFFTD